MPTAFTPGIDGPNAIVRPETKGIRNLISFRVFISIGTNSSDMFYESCDEFSIPKELQKKIWEKHWPKLKVNEESVEEFMKRVDKALYKAKDSGRNKVVAG